MEAALNFGYAELAKMPERLKLDLDDIYLIHFSGELKMWDWQVEKDGDKEVAFYQLAQGEGNIRYQSYGTQYEEWWVFYIDVKESKVVTCTDKNCY